MIVRAALWIGLLTGLTEVLVLELRLHFLGKFLILSRHLVWMTPMVDAVLFTAIGAILASLHRIRPRLVTAPRAVGILVFFAVMAQLIHFPELHQLAALMLAAGVAVQAGRVAAPRLVTMAGTARLGAPRLLLVLLVVALGFLWRERLEERQALARLPAARPGLPNVLLIILDTVRERSLSLYHYDRPTTPAIDRWARGGVIFDRAFAPAPWTLPSHAAMFTGRHPHQLAANDWETPLESGPLTLAEVLRGQGYATAGFVANVRYTARETGLARGFVHYEDYRIDIGEAIKSASLTEAFHSAYRQKLHLPSIRSRIWAPEINRRFLRWLDQRAPGRPFFAFLNYYDAHAPYQPPDSIRQAFETRPGAPILNTDGSRPNRVRHPETRFTEDQARATRDLYDGAIAALDANIGRLLDSLDARGLLENTIVVLTSDHGEAFAEHGVLGHANSLYRPVLQVPLVVVYPGHVPPGLRLPHPVSLEELAPTIADLAVGSNGEFPGRSLARFWNGAGESGHPDLLSHIKKLVNQPGWWPASAGDMFSVIRGDWHYIVNPATGKEELFNLTTDVAEQHDLAKTPVGGRELPVLRRALARLRG